MDHRDCVDSSIRVWRYYYTSVVLTVAVKAGARPVVFQELFTDGQTKYTQLHADFHGVPADGRQQNQDLQERFKSIPCAHGWSAVLEYCCWKRPPEFRYSHERYDSAGAHMTTSPASSWRIPSGKPSRQCFRLLKRLKIRPEQRFSLRDSWTSQRISM